MGSIFGKSANSTIIIQQIANKWVDVISTNSFV